MQRFIFSSDFYNHLKTIGDPIIEQKAKREEQERQIREERLAAANEYRYKEGEAEVNRQLKDVNVIDLPDFMRDAAKRGETSVPIRKIFNKDSCFRMAEYFNQTKLPNISFKPHPGENNYEYGWTPGSCVIYTHWGKEGFKEPGTYRQSYMEAKLHRDGRPGY